MTMKSIYLFTNSYPYTKSVEVFVEEEMRIAAKEGYKIFVIPTNSDKEIRQVPDNVTILPCLMDTGLLRKILLLISMPFRRNFWSMLGETGMSKKLPQGIKYLYGAYLTRQYIRKTIKSPSILYSYWFSYTALGMAMARDCNSILQKCTMISRGHGYDIFADQRGIYIPHRRFTLSKIDSLYPVSDAGTSYISGQYPEFTSKIHTVRLGISPSSQPKREAKPETISFVSCSSVIKLKRVDLIYEMTRTYSEKHPNQKVSWTHFGDGPMFNHIKQLCETRPKNMEVVLKGFTNADEIRRTYSEIGFDIFVNMSTTEGIPVSIMEALSAGIPAVATDVGGNGEIVCNDTGVIIQATPQYDDFESAVKRIIENHEELKKSTVEFFNRHYNAEKNYIDFYTTIMSL